MGKKMGWLHAVKKAMSCGSGQSSRKKNRKSGDWGKEVLYLDSYNAENAAVVPASQSPVGEAKLMEAENEQSRHAYSVALATAAAAEAAVAAAHAAAEVVRLTAAARGSGKTKEEIAAIKIQAAFRGHLARRALKALRGHARLRSLIEGQSVKRQATSTLKYMQLLGRMQSEVRARRTRKSEENLSIQHQIQQKHEREQLEKLRASIGEDWDDSMQSKEQIEANLQHRQEAAIRRERALAYAYTHQQTWRASSNSANQTFMDPSNPHWGWSWLERWMATRPHENGNATSKEQNSDHNSVKSNASRSVSILGDPKMQSPTAQKQSRPPSRQSPSTPKSKITPSKFRPASPRGTNGTDDDSKSIRSAQSDRCRRHSIAGSSVRDDESITSSQAATRGYMASTESTRAKSRMASPLGGERGGTPEKAAGGSAKKRLSFSGSPAGPRRHSGPPRVDISPMKDITTNS
ncbi:protein IQ-DOMAIN 3-like isoform X1 [Salvia miltiorrhiza]|uniref:protein IQ-DOMAIN 3-like isoform X1 n=1 Tax=Salvia miltiorrhiza TaxID=226208 RepID=UPI0025ACAD86|nr:protein IQ-DOMAIN 3-like isoform X1 [Salvia miltiorrhiza]